MEGRLSITAPDHLRTWLTNTLEPICDADPAALAKYVMALLKKDKSEADLKDFCVEQLDVFLQSETHGFVDRVFEAVKSRAYIPGGASQSAQTTVTLAEPSVSSSTTSSSDSREDGRPVVIQSAPKENRRSRSRDRARSREDRRRSPPTADPKRPAAKEERRRSRSRSPRDRSPRDRRAPARPTVDARAPSDRRAQTRTSESRPDPRGTSYRRRSRSPPLPKERSVIQRSKAERERGGSRSPGPRPLMDIKTHTPHLPPPGTEGAEELDAAIKELRKAKKQRCRDYDEKGYCMRGDRCPFDHGPDPVVVEDTQLPGMIVGTGPKPVTSTAPFSLPPPGFPKAPAPGTNPPPPGVDSYAPTPTSVSSSLAPPGSAPSVITEAYNPEAPALSSSSIMDKPYAYPPPPLPPSWSSQPPPPVLHPPFPRFPSGPIPPPGYPPFPPPGVPPHMDQSNLRALSDSGHRGRGRGGMHIGHRLGPRPPHFRPQQDNKTLEIRKVPPQLNSIVKLNEHFQTFGQIINIQVRYDGDPEAALITFATRPQALNAYKSTSPILNNRFIKVFWHNADKGGEDAPSAQPTPNPAPPKIPDRQAFKKVNTGPEVRREGEMEKSDAPRPPPAFYGREDALARRQAKKRDKEKKLAYLALHKKKTELLSKQMASQKLLVAQMEKCTDNPKKTKELIQMFKTLDKANKALTKEVAELAETMKGMASGGPRTKEQLEKEKLDVELELFSKTQEGLDTAPLQHKLSALRNELVSLTRAVKDGGPLMTSTPSGSEDWGAEALGLGRRGVRRVSSSEGGPPMKRQRSLMMSDKKLDKRPKNLLVTGFSEDQRDGVTKHLESFGQITDMEFDYRGDAGGLRALVTFKTRQQAETALELAEDYEGVEKALKVVWGPSQTATASVSTESVGKKEIGAEEVVEVKPASINHHMSAEELLKSIDDPSDEDSLGGDDEDEDPEIK